MIKNYIKTAFRTLIKNKGFTAINILGLALGLAVCLLIVFYVADELSYDRYNVNADRIVRANSDVKFGGNENLFATTPAILATALKSDFPEVEQVTRFRYQGGFKVKKDDQNIQENKVIYADPTIFSVFTLPMINGDFATALKEPHTVVITERTAKKYFNTTRAVGRLLTVNDTALYKVTGVIKNIPSQSHFNYDFFVAMAGLNESRSNSWLSANFNTYVLLKKGVDFKELDAKMPEFLRKHATAELQEILHLTFKTFEQSGNHFRINYTPLTKIHLESNRVAELSANGNLQYVYIFGAIAIFILLIACVNFMNLSTASLSNRAREIGVRKVLGSPRKFLIVQFLTESIMITLVAAIIAVFAAWALLPLFNQISGKELAITTYLAVHMVPVLIAVVIIIGALAGSYPALYLSGFKPKEVLKGKIAAGFKGGVLRSFLVVFQFSISIFLIVGTIIIYNQLKYIQSTDLGYSRDHVFIVHHAESLGAKAKAFKQEIQQIAGVQSATLTAALPTTNYSNSSSLFKNPVADQKSAILTQTWPVDEDYIPTLDIKMAKGRNFSNQMPTDSDAIVINETAAKQLNFSNPINKVLYRPQDNEFKRLKPYHIIGVMKDFNFNTLRDNVTSLVIFLDNDRGALSIRFNSANIPALINQVKSKWSAFLPNQQFSYSFMNKDFESIYRAEQHMGQIFIVFTSLAIIIACLGLFGLVAYAAEQRNREIGVRKVLGATVANIVTMLSADFIKLVFIAILIALPVAWYVMHKWLQNFAYRIAIHWWILAIAGIIALFIAFITVSFQSIKAALTNPVKSLKSE